MSDEWIEDAVPIELLYNDIVLLDCAISMIGQLIPQIAAARHDRHSISNTKTFSPPIQQGHAGAAGQYGVTHNPLPCGDTLHNKPAQKAPANHTPDKVSLCHRLSLQSSRKDLADGLLPWHSILLADKQQLPLSTGSSNFSEV